MKRTSFSRKTEVVLALLSLSIAIASAATSADTACRNPDKKLFVSYEDPRSLRLKCRMIRERGLGGAMFWEYSEDADGELLRTLYEELLAAR